MTTSHFVTFTNSVTIHQLFETAWPNTYPALILKKSIFGISWMVEVSDFQTFQISKILVFSRSPPHLGEQVWQGNRSGNREFSCASLRHPSGKKSRIINGTSYYPPHPGPGFTSLQVLQQEERTIKRTTVARAGIMIIPLGLALLYAWILTTTKWNDNQRRNNEEKQQQMILVDFFLRIIDPVSNIICFISSWDTSE